MSNYNNEGEYEGVWEIGENGKLVLKEERKRKEEQKRISTCYDAIITSDGKYQCPECKNIEGGTLRVITHKYKCLNTDRKYCKTSGGRRKYKHRKHTKKARKSRRGRSRKHRS